MRILPLLFAASGLLFIGCNRAGSTWKPTAKVAREPELQLPAAISGCGWAFTFGRNGRVNLNLPGRESVPILQLPPMVDGQSVSGRLTVVSGQVCWVSSTPAIQLSIAFDPRQGTVEAESQTALELSFLTYFAPPNPQVAAAFFTPGHPLRLKPGLKFLLVQIKTPKFDRIATTIQVEGVDADQVAIHSMVAGLTGFASSEEVLGPFGATSARYDQHIFWDHDAWIFPSLAVLSPIDAKKISDLRLRSLGQAALNYKKQFPTGPHGYKFSWESNEHGAETSPTETKDEVHVSASVIRGLDWAADLGIADPKQVEAAGQGVAAFYDQLASPDGHIRGVLGADEWRRVDDDLYTNMSASWVIQKYGVRHGAPLTMPHDQQGYLSFADDPVTQYQQASALLTLFPLQAPQAEREGKLMWRRFKDRTSPNGPLMSDSLHALIGARLGFPDEAYAYWKKSWAAGGNFPGYSLPEKTMGDVVFYTGVAGSLNSVIYGFLGLRIDDHDPGKVPWKLPLKRGSFLSCQPHLPREWHKLTLKNALILGRRLTFVATHKGLTVTPAP